MKIEIAQTSSDERYMGDPRDWPSGLYRMADSENDTTPWYIVVQDNNGFSIRGNHLSALPSDVSVRGYIRVRGVVKFDCNLPEGV